MGRGQPRPLFCSVLRAADAADPGQGGFPSWWPWDSRPAAAMARPPRPFPQPQRFSCIEPCGPSFPLWLHPSTQNHIHKVTVTHTQNCSEIFIPDLQILDLPMTFLYQPLTPREAPPASSSETLYGNPVAGSAPKIPSLNKQPEIVVALQPTVWEVSNERQMWGLFRRCHMGCVSLIAVLPTLS